MVADTAALVATSAADAGVRVSVEASGPVCVEADPDRLSEAVLNLLSNAIKYNRAGGTVMIATSAPSDGLVALAVSDTGPGIPSDLLGRLYTPFDRLGAERTRVTGTGLGLALCKQSVEAMGGTIDVVSTPGVGSTFTITLPAARERCPEPLAEPPLPHGELRVARGSVTRHILYIEDDASNRALMERALAGRSGIELVTAQTAADGLSQARERQPSLILLDLNLPDADGEEVLVALQQDQRTRRTPVVVLSADASPDRIARLTEVGACAYLTKPVRFNELFAEIDRTFAELPG